MRRLILRGGGYVCTFTVISLIAYNAGMGWPLSWFLAFVFNVGLAALLISRGGGD